MKMRDGRLNTQGRVDASHKPASRLGRMQMSDLVERLREQANRAANWYRHDDAATCTEAAARIQALETSLAEAEGRVKWVFPKSIADMPVKPGKAAYEYVECLILRKGDMLCRPWNCEHQVFDDEAQDDFFCEWSEITAYMELTAIRALASDEVKP